MQYNPALDGLRALAILAVVFFHCAAPWGSGGYLGVDVFFVLSGYLITTLLAAEHRKGSIEIGAFYARRALRLYPTLLVIIVVYLLLAPVLWPADDRWLMAALTGFYLLDYALAFWVVPYTLGHTWSLGVEEKFYLLWPLLLPLIMRARRPLTWLLAAFIAATAWRYFVTLRWGVNQAYFSFDTRLSGILLGAIAALVPLRISRLTLAIACVALAAAVAVPIIPTTPRSIPTIGATLAITLGELCAFVLVSYVAQNRDCLFLASRPMAYIGKLSYGIYVWHFPVVLLLRDVHSQPWEVTLSATLLFSFAMAIICLHLVDAPIKRWREKTASLKAPAASLTAET